MQDEILCRMRICAKRVSRIRISVQVMKMNKCCGKKKISVDI